MSKVLPTPIGVGLIEARVNLALTGSAFALPTPIGVGLIEAIQSKKPTWTRLHYRHRSVSASLKLSVHGFHLPNTFRNYRHRSVSASLKRVATCTLTSSRSRLPTPIGVGLIEAERRLCLSL